MAVSNGNPNETTNSLAKMLNINGKETGNLPNINS